ncbi:MAG: hypothetical protein K2W82_16620 [Candidatus Obscuribacterales bacterium]|nr:hypothetical protein [Candidatus Obscuribacterales bacterium]
MTTFLFMVWAALVGGLLSYIWGETIKGLRYKGNTTDGTNTSNFLFWGGLACAVVGTGIIHYNWQYGWVTPFAIIGALVAGYELVLTFTPAFASYGLNFLERIVTALVAGADAVKSSWQQTGRQNQQA